MRIKLAVLLFLLALSAATDRVACAALRIVSGETSVEVVPTGRKFLLDITSGTQQVRFFDRLPITLVVDGEVVSAAYSDCTQENGTLCCRGEAISANNSRFIVTDIYRLRMNDSFELQRTVEVENASARDNSFNSLFGFVVGRKSDFDKCEFFIPAVWYKSNFTPAGNLPPHIPQKNDDCFLYRNDRLPLPIVMSRNPESGFTLSMIQKGPESRTVMADRTGARIDRGYQFGSLGIRKQDNRIQMLFAYPGTEEGRRGGFGARAHPVHPNVRHTYTLELCFSCTPDYATAVKQTWERAFECHDPGICKTDSELVYKGLIETLLHYYVPSIRTGGVYDEPGFPFQVSLKDFRPMGIDYQMGFVGMQVATGYYLYRDGIEKGDREILNKGKDVLDFWSGKSLTGLGYPRCWYDPKKDGTAGRFRKHSTLRTTTGGMESLLEAWCFARRNNIYHPAWIRACRKFGEWLTANQNPDGSWYFAYDHTRIVDGRHPATNENKFLTICAVRYLVNLYLATGDSKYRDAALRAGEFCYERIHKEYAYVACVTDNPQTIDSESGQMALNGFLSLYDLTGDRRWLAAAEQAATYVETWVYMHEIPVEEDCDTPVVVPKERSVVGQHLIAVGQIAADLGFAWNSFNFYRLYLITGDEHYFEVARIATHNTRQTMNWDGSLYPGQQRGLQLEAFRIMVPRRGRGVLTTLNWNYAAHLDPMIRFKDAFGSCDIERIDRMPREELQRLNVRYATVQSADLGTKQ